MASPRKFSEKIALHNQKQAEETAAFEAIMRDVAESTKVGSQKQPRQTQQQPRQQTQPQSQQQHQQQQPQLMHLAQPQLGVYRGGSLPNVNQSIDLQGALEDMKQMSGRESLIDRYHRQRQMQSPHRRPFPFDKRTDCSPYGAAYLSPPPDTSWRRTSSDSAIHTSSIGQQNMDNSVPPENINMYELHQQSQVRPKSCEVPGINIYPSPEQGQSIPISNNTGSLPDLTHIHFPSPLATPLDAPHDESIHAHNVQYINHHGGHHGNLSPAAQHHPHHGHHHIGAIRQGHGSPGARRREPVGGPTPLVLQGSPTQMRHAMSPQLHEPDLRGLHAPSQYHPYGSPHSPDRRSPSHSPHRSSPGHSPHRPSPVHSPNLQQILGNTLTVPCTLPVPLQNYIASQNVSQSTMQQQQQQQNHLLTSMDSLSMNSDKILRLSPGSPASSMNSALGPTLQSPVNTHGTGVRFNQMQQPQIVIYSETSSTPSFLDMNGHISDSHLVSATTSTQMCSKESDNRQTSPRNYRNSQSDCPASPNSPVSPHSFSPAQSPGLPQSTSPSEAVLNNGVSSAGAAPPCIAPAGGGGGGGNVFNDSYFMHQQSQTNALQHQFEQFNMFFPTLDNTDINTTVSIYHNMVNHQQQYSQANSPLSGSPSYMTGSNGGGPICSPQQQNHFFKQTSNNGSPHHHQHSHHHHHHQPHSPHQSPASPAHQQQQQQHQGGCGMNGGGSGPPSSPHSNQMTPSPTQLTPQEQFYHNLSPPQMSPQPGNIPDIILTGADDLSKHDFSKDLSHAMQQVHDFFGDADLLPSDEAIKDGLDPLNFSDLQMLTDPSILTDPGTEESFRSDMPL